MLQPAFNSDPGASAMWHSIKLFVLPLVTLGAGIVPLYIDPKENQKGRRILLVVLVVAAIGSVVVAISDDRDKRSSEPKSKRHRQATIWYFPKRVDGPVVMDALREAGFKVQTAQGKDINKDLPTNRIWVGDSILLEDAKFVALTLTRAGVGSPRLAVSVIAAARKQIG